MYNIQNKYSVSTWDLCDKDTKMDAGDPPYTQLHHLNPHDDDGSDCDFEAKDDDDYEERLVVMMISDWKSANSTIGEEARNLNRTERAGR